MVDAAAPPRRALHGHPPQARQATVEHEPAGAHHHSLLDRDQVQRLVIAPVAIGRRGHPLLSGEDPLAQPQGCGDLRGGAGDPDLHGAQRA